MNNLVFVSGDFCSGSTLLFTLFRKTGQYYTLYEPLHELMLQYYFWPLPPDDHHFFVERYHSELKGFDKIPHLFNPSWGNSNLYLTPESDADNLYRYLSYLIGTAFGRGSKVLLKENRLTFRLGWLRSKFPGAKIVHIYRKKEDQWKSVLRRVQAWHGREDVGQNDVTFNGFSIHTWCEDLKGRFPELEASKFQSGYERFCKLWDLSFAENVRYADVSIDYGDLLRDFEPTCERVWQSIGATGIDTAHLKQFVVSSPNNSKRPPIVENTVADRARRLIHRAGMRYARARVRVSTRQRTEIPGRITFPEVVRDGNHASTLHQQQGFTILITGLSGAGKSTLAQVLQKEFLEREDRRVTVLDGDIVRRHLSSELGFSKEHREMHIRRIGFVAGEITKNGGVTLCAVIAPYDSMRKELRATIEPHGRFVLVYLSTPLSVCEQRDHKGLYAKARAGIVTSFTGISDPYEVPDDADVVISMEHITPQEAAQLVLQHVKNNGYLATKSVNGERKHSHRF